MKKILSLGLVLVSASAWMSSAPYLSQVIFYSAVTVALLYGLLFYWLFDTSGDVNQPETDSGIEPAWQQFITWMTRSPEPPVNTNRRPMFQKYQK